MNLTRTHFIAIQRDITARKRMEYDWLQTQSQEVVQLEWLVAEIVAALIDKLGDYQQPA